jgi:hypothetical protein
LPVFLQQGGRNEAYRKGNSKRHEQQIIQIAKHRHKVRDEIYRAKGIGGHTGRNQFRVPWHTRITRSKVQRDDITFKRARPLANPLEYTHYVPPLISSRDTEDSMGLLALLFLLSWLAATVSGAAGFGGALLLPILAATLGVKTAVPVLTIMQLLGNLSRVWFGRTQIAWKPRSQLMIVVSWLGAH